ncbi:hypothetical protein [Paenibacillus sp. P32E]|uniref:hypothetical protein n=1 Tax=Paenibacillus sp. P32E TaxID=1349434 RepID=UPI00093E7A80|nr:hypothetical protein [Paenibacillus sp. P32E]OKP86582.1 hypothetical protein A3848_21470 [Paenibacillus sp. P32E]
MDSRLKSIIDNVKNKLIDEPDSIIIGELNHGNKFIKTDEVHLKDYFDFLSEVDGARCGAIDLWSYDELSQHQIRVSDYLDGKWLEIGQVLYEPIVINENSGQVYCFKLGYPFQEAQPLGDFNYFLINYVFGRKYEELVPDSHLDYWYQFLEKIRTA